MLPENVLPLNTIEQLPLVPLGMITKLDPKLACDPVPLFVIVLLSTLKSASRTLLRFARMPPVVLPLMMLFWI